MDTQTEHTSKTKLLRAALRIYRTKGYAASTIDDICLQAGVTKGSFFHHFKGKEDLTLAAADFWNKKMTELFEAAAFHQFTDPVQRLFGYLDFREVMLKGDPPAYTCLLGTLVQEVYATHPEIRAACDRGMSAHIAALSRDVELARRHYAPDATWTSESVGHFIQDVLQGAFIMAKARQDSTVVKESLAHLRRYLEFIFNQRSATI
jgi:TetR/AcrR family transcriptional repressor of nem operon